MRGGESDEGASCYKNPPGWLWHSGKPCRILEMAAVYGFGHLGISIGRFHASTWFHDLQAKTLKYC